MIFPTLAGRPGAYVNLNNHARMWLNKQKPVRGSNPLLDPDICRRMVEEIHKDLRVPYSYGGWMEDRSTLWRGSYLDHREFYLHLGVDLNAPVNTPVAIDHHGVVLEIESDHPLTHGWGTRVLIQIRPSRYLIYAHITDVRAVVGEPLSPGDIIGVIAPSDRNGYWYPHVHVQTLTEEAYERYQKSPEEFDGYGPLKERERLRELYPNPENFFRFQ